jgi:hypothetical protein
MRMSRDEWPFERAPLSGRMVAQECSIFSFAAIPIPTGSHFSFGDDFAYAIFYAVLILGLAFLFFI